MIENATEIPIFLQAEGRRDVVIRSSGRAVIWLNKTVQFDIAERSSAIETNSPARSCGIQENEHTGFGYCSSKIRISVSLSEEVEAEVDPRRYYQPWLSGSNDLSWKLMRPHLDGFLLVFYGKNVNMEECFPLDGPCIQESSF